MLHILAEDPALNRTAGQDVADWMRESRIDVLRV
jgi:hypothetical protein